MSDPSTAIAPAPFVAALEPYVAAAAAATVTGLAGIAVRAFTRWTGVRISAEMQARVASAAANEAGALVAAASDNLATRSIPVGSPMVADAARRIQSALPGVMNATGLTTTDVAAMVAGEIGKLQARMTAQPTPAPPPK